MGCFKDGNLEPHQKETQAQYARPAARGHNGGTSAQHASTTPVAPYANNHGGCYGEELPAREEDG